MSQPETSSSSTVLAPVLLVASLAMAHAFPAKAWPMAGLAIVSVNALLLFWGAALAIRRKVSLPVAPVLLAAAWLIWSWAGIYRMPVPSAAGETISRIFSGYVALLVAAIWMALARDEGEREHEQACTILIGGLACVLAIMAIHAVWQRFWGFDESLRMLEGNPGGYDAVMLDAMRHALEMRAPGSTFGDANTCAALMALGVGLFCGFAASRITIGRVIVGGVGIVLCLFAAILTQSRGGMLTVLLAIFCGVLLLWKALRNRAGHARHHRWIWIGLVGLSVILVASITIFLSTTSLGAEWRRRMMASSTVAQRVYYLQSSYRMWIEHPLLGNGPGGFALHYARHRIPGAGETADPHNWIARIAVEQGLIGLILFMAWIASVMLTLRSRETTPFGHLLRCTAACGALLVMFNGLLQHAFATREVYVDLALLLGVVAGVNRHSRENGKRFVPYLIPSAVVVAALFYWPLLLRPDLVRAYMDRSRERSLDVAYYRSSGESLLAQQLAQEALHDAERAVALEPRNPWALDYMAALLFGMPEVLDRPRAIALQEKAVELHPLSATLRDNLARMHMAMDEPDEALAIWEKAIALHPLDEELYAHRAQLYAGREEWDKALEDAYRAAKLTMRFREGYWKAYFDLVEKSSGQRAASDPGVDQFGAAPSGPK